jgi:hypothetical protein
VDFDGCEERCIDLDDEENIPAQEYRCARRLRIWRACRADADQVRQSALFPHLFDWERQVMRRPIARLLKASDANLSLFGSGV